MLGYQYKPSEDRRKALQGLSVAPSVLFSIKGGQDNKSKEGSSIANDSKGNNKNIDGSKKEGKSSGCCVVI